MGNEAKDYIHQGLYQEVRAIGGHYLLTKEARLDFNGREILYVLGFAQFDTTCCGNGACNYAFVPGFVKEWKTSENDEGIPVSRVEPINDKAVQKNVQRLIEQQEMVTQVNFY